VWTMSKMRQAAAHLLLRRPFTQSANKRHCPAVLCLLQGCCGARESAARGALGGAQARAGASGTGLRLAVVYH